MSALTALIAVTVILPGLIPQVREVHHLCKGGATPPPGPGSAAAFVKVQRWGVEVPREVLSRDSPPADQ